MAQVELKIPSFGEGDTEEMVVLEWIVDEGDLVDDGTDILELESDKANITIPSSVKGFVFKQLVQKGDKVKEGDPFLLIETDLSLRKNKLPHLTNKGYASVKLRLGVICEHCNNAIPVNGFVETVKCNKCQETTPLKGRLRWPEILNYQNPSIDIFKATLKHKMGQGDRVAWAPVKLTTIRQFPGCLYCEHVFSTDELDAAINGNKTLTCTKCSRQNTLKPPPGFITKDFPQVVFSLDAMASDNHISGDQIKGNSPVVMACMSCGGTLSIDGTTRLVTCTFCSSRNYLPDDLWLALHPQPKMEDWYIVFSATAV